jgi:phage terminase small subunit
VAKNPIDKPSLTIINPRSSIPKPPANLGPAGATLWRSIMSEYAIDDAGGRALLKQAATAYDRAEQLRIEIERDGEIIRSRSGVPREHPGLRAEMAARSFMVRTLQRLGINLEAVRTAPRQPEWAHHDD